VSFMTPSVQHDDGLRRVASPAVPHRQVVNQEHMRRPLQGSAAQRPARLRPRRGETSLASGTARIVASPVYPCLLISSIRRLACAFVTDRASLPLHPVESRRPAARSRLRGWAIQLSSAGRCNRRPSVSHSRGASGSGPATTLRPTSGCHVATAPEPAEPWTGPVAADVPETPAQDGPTRVDRELSALLSSR
jgi:hypothetical protein